MLAALLIVGGLEAFGCRQVLGIEDREGQPIAGSDSGITTKGQCGGFDYATSECAACMDQSCCDELTDCDASPSCSSRLSCFLACAPNDAACRARCYQYQGPDGSVWSEGRARFCMFESCRTQCGLSCTAARYPSVACEDCVRKSCCSEVRACQEDEKCALPGLCGCAVKDAACFAQCASEFTDSAKIQAEARTCKTDKCSVCYAPVWTCLDEPRSWLKPKSAEDIAVSFKLQDYVSYKPKSNVQISACNAADVACTEPVSKPATVSSDQDGLAELKIPVGLVGFSGYFQVKPAPGDPDPVADVIFQHTSPPLVESWSFIRTILSRNEFDFFAQQIIGEEPDPALGHIVIEADDCNRALASGVAFELSDPTLGAVGFYLDESGLPAKLEQTVGPTNLGGFGNVKPGSVTVIARVASTQQKIAQVNVIVRKNTLTFVAIGPAP